MNITRDIQPLSSFKRETARIIQQINDTKEPVIITVNGKPSVVVQDAESYQELLDIKERMETIAAIRLGLDSMKRGKGKTLAQFDADFRKRHGLPAGQ